MDELEQLRQQLEELKALRDRLAVDEEKVEEQEQEIVEEEPTDLRAYLEDELSKIDKEIEEIEKEVNKTAKEYEASYKRLQTIIDEYDSSIVATKLLSDEEYNDLRQTTENLKLEENERSIEIKRRLDAQRKIIRELKGKRTRLENDLNKSEALGLTYDEYKEITATIRRTSIMNAILEEKGLGNIIEKKANERTQEEKDLLKKTKEEILTEISEFKANKEYDDYSVLDIIEALYSLENTYTEVKKPRETKVTSKELMVINENKQILPYKIVNPNIQETKIEEKVEEAPKDMENAKENEKVDINELKPAEEKVTLFKDTSTDDYYVRKYAIDRFKLKSADLGNEVRINGSLCYKISEYDVNRIKENANNAFSPYLADIKEITLEKEKSNEIDDKDTKDELIPGTNIKRPRDRRIDETDEEYEAFLKSYYDKVFPKENEDKKDIEEVKEDTPIVEQEESLIVPNTEEKALRVISQPEDPKEELEEYITVKEELKDEDIDSVVKEEINKEEEPIEIEIDPNSGIVIDFDKKEELKDEDIDSVVKEELEEELKDEDIDSVVKEEINKEEELTDDDIKSAIDESLEEELTKDEIINVVDGELKAAIPEIETEEEKNDDDDERLKNVWYYATAVKASNKFKQELKKGNVLYNIVHKVPKVIATISGKIGSLFEETADFMGSSVGGTVYYHDDLPRYR